MKGRAMRSLFSPLPIVLFSTVLASSSAKAKDFELKAETQEAFEGGPVVIKLTLSYIGKDTIEANLQNLYHPDQTIDLSCIDVSAPKSWRKREWGEPFEVTYFEEDLKGGRKEKKITGRIGDGTSVGIILGNGKLEPGKTFSHLAFLHHRFEQIPSGRYRLTFTWFIQAMREKEKLADPTVSLDIEVAKATPERLVVIRKKVEEGLTQRNPPADTFYNLSKMIIRTQHSSELLPICFQMLQPGIFAQELERYPLLSYVYDLSRKSPEIHEQLLQFLQKHGTQDDRYFFWLWKSDKVRLTSKEVAILLSSTNAWIKALTFKHYPELCPAGTKEAIEQEVHQLRSLLDEK
jgi:hypothetical protein